jgi:N-acetylneuraminate synthase
VVVSLADGGDFHCLADHGTASANLDHGKIMEINGKRIGIGSPPYIVAEISANHHGSVREAKELIDCAHDIGADAVKIQCYTAEGIVADTGFRFDNGIWSGKTLLDIYRQAQTPPKMVKELFRHAKMHHITLFSSVFDLEGVDFCVKLGAPAIKIASFELIDLPLICEAAKTGLPVIISTGMGTMQEVKDAVNTFHRFALDDEREKLALLHCVSEYPSSAREANLPNLGPLSAIHGGHHVVGLSDHTLGLGVAAAAVALGAAIIEKHLILDRKLGGPDAAFSSEPGEFAAMIKACREAHEACLPFPVPRSSYRQFRKSLYVVRTISAGTPLSKDNVRSLRPALGLSPKTYQSILGQVATRELSAGTPLQEGMFVPASDWDGNDLRDA